MLLNQVRIRLSPSRRSLAVLLSQELKLSARKSKKADAFILEMLIIKASLIKRSDNENYDKLGAASRTWALPNCCVLGSNYEQLGASRGKLPRLAPSCP